MSLTDCLVLGRQRQVTDNRDHVYGILGLAMDSSIKPDYSLSAHEVYMRLARHIIERDKSLDILSACKVTGLDEVQVSTVKYSPFHTVLNADSSRGWRTTATALHL
jgi:hypothetical protein